MTDSQGQSHPGGDQGAGRHQERKGIGGGWRGQGELKVALGTKMAVGNDAFNKESDIHRRHRRRPKQGGFHPRTQLCRAGSSIFNDASTEGHDARCAIVAGPEQIRIRLSPRFHTNPARRTWSATTTSCNRPHDYQAVHNALAMPKLQVP